ncbi:hypothetical protein [Taibaiella soli]|uniref:Uncharacterized protein n=1 Tax=Taibaiella soli TaxID=1649169 RepID=A0A2W2AD49_9BACT|nr:hypothetical protein [Taibaiella soli]PZF73171.1 hypothetical protein DN068_09880 [Taibaiella soli]
MLFSRKINLLFWLLLFSLPVMAREHGKKSPTEQDMVSEIVSCLRAKDGYAYIKLFPPSDSMASWIVQSADQQSKLYAEMVNQLQNPEIGMHTDSMIDALAKGSFDSVITKGENMGIHWSAIVQVRYELIKMKETRDRVYEKVAPTRFLGFIFFRDMLTRKTYGVSVNDIMQIRGDWYGGQIKGLFLASTTDEYLAALKKKKKKNTDSLKTAAATESADAPTTGPQKIIVERKLYSGMFDNQIPVQLYIRYLKGNCPEVTCIWEAFYKFGDQDDYIKLDVSKNPDGKWVFTENPAQGSMELTLDKDKYTGTWLSSDNQTGYDVKLTEIPATPKKIERMDEVFEKELFSK